MKAAIFIASLSPEGVAEEKEAALAFCAAHGLEPVCLYRAETVQTKARIDAFLKDVRSGRFELVVAPYPDCFSSRILKGLVASGVGLACHSHGRP